MRLRVVYIVTQSLLSLTPQWLCYLLSHGACTVVSDILRRHTLWYWGPTLWWPNGSVSKAEPVTKCHAGTPEDTVVTRPKHHKHEPTTYPTCTLNKRNNCEKETNATNTNTAVFTFSLSCGGRIKKIIHMGKSILSGIISDLFTLQFLPRVQFAWAIQYDGQKWFGQSDLRRTISRKDADRHWFCSLALLISLHQSTLMASHQWWTPLQ